LLERWKGVGGEIPAESGDKVVGGEEESGFVGVDEEVGADGLGVGGTSGEGKDVPSVREGDVGGDECAAVVWSFDDDERFGESGDDAVSAYEIGFVG
jgi:hypothetical protein